MCRFSLVKISISIPEEWAKFMYVSLFQIQPTTKTIIPAHALTIGKKQHANIRWEFPFGKNLLQFHIAAFAIVLNRFTLLVYFKRYIVHADENYQMLLHRWRREDDLAKSQTSWKNQLANRNSPRKGKDWRPLSLFVSCCPDGFEALPIDTCCHKSEYVSLRQTNSNNNDTFFFSLSAACEYLAGKCIRKAFVVVE